MEHCRCAGSLFQSINSVFHAAGPMKKRSIFITGTLMEHYWNTGSVPAEPSIHAGCSLMEHWNTDFYITRINRANGLRTTPAVP